MKIISHRGYWIHPEEKNKREAFIRSFSKGFGTETDVRDLNGQLVISHDMPRTCDNPILFSEMLDIYKFYGCPGTLALNIKSDGLQDKLKSILKEFSIGNYVLFDMSIPDTIVTAQAGLNFLTRQSDVEITPLMLGQAIGVWLDEFDSEWIDRPVLDSLLNIGKHCFIVSPELHGRNHLPIWEKYKLSGISGLVEVTLCTDLPEKAVNYFGEAR